MGPIVSRWAIQPGGIKNGRVRSIMKQRADTGEDHILQQDPNRPRVDSFQSRKVVDVSKTRLC